MKHLSKTINEIVKEKMELGLKEQVSYELCQKAYLIAKNLKIHTKKDVILFCAAMNLLNTYVKQSDSSIGYGFKKYIKHLFVALSKHSIQNVRVGMDVQTSKKRKEIAYVIIQIDNVQFSFHQIVLTDVAHYLEEIVEPLAFDGLKKQVCAVTIFEMVKAA